MGKGQDYKTSVLFPVGAALPQLFGLHIVEHLKSCSVAKMFDSPPNPIQHEYSYFYIMTKYISTNVSEEANIL